MLNAQRLGEFFRGHRVSAGLDEQQAAELLEIGSADALKRYETGEVVLPLKIIFAMTNLYNISPDSVMALFYGLSVGEEPSRKGAERA